MRERKVRKYTRRKIPPGFSIALPRQACPNCSILIDVRIRKDGEVFFINTGKVRGHGTNAEMEEAVDDFRYGGTKGGLSESEERNPLHEDGVGEE